MSIESQLREKLHKIEALFAGAGTAGERLAAEAALERVRARLAELGQRDPSVEIQFSMPDQWSRHLFLALCRRYGLKPYRLHRQRRNTVMIRAPKGFIDQVLWPEFTELDRALQAYLHEVTLRVIREEVYAEIVDDRHNRGSTIVTSQLPVDHWHEVIANPTVADAILDRLVHNSHRLTLNGDSMRKSAARRSGLDASPAP
jgi:IstB-like ATP binding protein